MSMAGDNEYELLVSDNGVGLPEGFDIEKTDSLGLILVKQLVEGQLEGAMDINRENGTEFRIRFKELPFTGHIQA